MLTVKDIRKLKKDATDRQRNKSTGDGNGLTICTAPKKKGAHQWFEGRFRYQGKSDSHYLGTFEKKLSLKDARQKWSDIYRWYHENDCLIHPRYFKNKNRSGKLLSDAVDNYWKEKQNLKATTIPDYKNKINNLIIPALGAKTPLKVLQWNHGGKDIVEKFLGGYKARGKTSSESKLRGLLKEIFELAIHAGMMERGENPAIKPKVKTTAIKVVSQPSITWGEVPKLLNDIETNPVNGWIETVLAVKFLLMTFLRVGALVRMEWDWLDADKDCIIVPSETQGLKRLKGVTDEPLYIPLTTELRLLLDELEKINGHEQFVFASARGRTPHLCNDAPNNHLKKLGYKGLLTAHGWRQVPTTSGQEVLKVAPEVIDRQLGHLIGTSAFRAYDKNTQMLDERREFLSQWHRALVERGLKVSSVEGDIDQ